MRFERIYIVHKSNVTKSKPTNGSMITHVDKCIKPDEFGRKSQSWISSRIAPLDSTTWHKMYLFIYHMTCRMKSKRSRQTDCKCKVFCFSEKWHNTPKFNNNDPISSHFTMQWNPSENCISWFYFCYQNYHQYWLLNLAVLISRGYKKSHVFEKYSMRY